MQIGKIIKEKRKKFGMTQSQLANNLSLSTAYICMIEKDERVPSLKEFVKIVNYLEIPIKEILCGALNI